MFELRPSSEQVNSEEQLKRYLEFIDRVLQRIEREKQMGIDIIPTSMAVCPYRQPYQPNPP